MGTIFIILTIIVLAIILSEKLQSLTYRLEGLRKEVKLLREQWEAKNSPVEVPVENIQEPFAAEPSVVDTPPPVPPEPITEDFQTEKESVASEPSPVISPLSSEPEVEPEVVTRKAPKRKVNYEKLIGENLFGKIGILILVAGIGLFVKYAIDNEWINETMRTIMGFSVGIVLLFISKRLHPQYRTFSSLLAGGAFAMFYVTTAIAYHYYGVFSQTVAFIILIAVTLFMSGLSILYNRRELAAIALTGGFLAPFLVSSGTGNYITLFSYILILNGGMFTIALYKKWGELPVISFFFTWLCLLIYLLNSSSLERSNGILFVFATGYYLMFLLPFILILKDKTSMLNRLLSGIIILNHFIFLGFGLYFIHTMHTGIKTDGLLSLGIALVNTGIAVLAKKQLQESKLLFSLSVAAAITFVSLTVPIQFDGDLITIFWASEMVILLFLSIRSDIRLFEYFSYLLAGLALISLKVIMIPFNGLDTSRADATIFLNGNFFTHVYTGLCFLVSAWLLMKYKVALNEKNNTYVSLNTIALAIACFLLLNAPIHEFREHITDRALSSLLQCLYLGVYLLCLSALFRKRFPVGHYLQGYLIGAAINTGTFIIAFLFYGGSWLAIQPGILAWIYLIIIFIQIYYISKTYYSQISYTLQQSRKYTITVNLVSSICFLILTWMLLTQFYLGQEFKAGFSICLAIVGFIQMLLGMRLHYRLLRGISLITFGIILLKLVVMDIWQLPTVGKIIVFILLGIVLLLLSFMYQKLKNVLFKDNHNVE